MGDFTIEPGIQAIATLRGLKATKRIELKESISTLNEEMDILYGLEQPERKKEIIEKVHEYYAPILKKYHERCIQNAKTNMTV